jgi:hypothetical protein
MWQIACSGETIGDYEGGILIRWIQEQIGHLLPFKGIKVHEFALLSFARDIPSTSLRGIQVDHWFELRVCHHYKHVPV